MRAYAAINRLRHRFLTYGRVAAWSPSIQGPGGTVLRDYSGRGGDGTLTNMDPASDWIHADGTALDFDGSNDYVAAPNPCNFGSASDYALSLWFRCGSTAASYRTMAIKRVTGVRHPMSAFLTPAHKLQLDSWNGGSGGAAVVTSATVNDGSWHHAVLSHTNDGTLSGYLDGVLTGTASDSGQNTTYTQDVRFGADTTISRDCRGQLYDISIYDQALSAPEIRVVATHLSRLNLCRVRPFFPCYLLTLTARY